MGRTLNLWLGLILVLSAEHDQIGNVNLYKYAPISIDNAETFVLKAGFNGEEFNAAALSH